MIQSDTDLQTVEKIIDQLGELPSAPVILKKALTLTSDLESNIDDISKNISADQALAAKVIRMSNSPIYGRVKRITSLNEAIQVLGFNQVKSIIISASTFQVFQSCEHRKIADLLWEHSLATALGARLITRKYQKLNREEAYLCGLLHDIGKLVLLQTTPNVYLQIIEQVKETQQSFIQIENKELGFTHVNTGYALLQKWEFPPELISQISAHHATNLTQIEPSMSHARVIAIADSIAKYNGASFYQAYQLDTEGDIYLGNTLIDEDSLIELRIQAEEQFNTEINSFYS